MSERSKLAGSNGMPSGHPDQHWPRLLPLHGPAKQASARQSELDYPERLVHPSNWVGHIPFAMWLVDSLRPRKLVELGVHSGNSYCAFLQAALASNIDCACFGVDHWLGEEHAGAYGEEVYRELHKYHDPKYASFSTLIRSAFDEALARFSDRSIDLLHVDGLHTYEAVAGDFGKWLPKMSARGVMLFHDTNVRERNFGVWRLWEEIAATYPTFEFLHAHGLGVAYVGSAPPPDGVAAFFSRSDPDTITQLRTYFARLGTSLEDRYRATELDAALRSQIDATQAALKAKAADAEEYALRIGEMEASINKQRIEFERQRVELERQISAVLRQQATIAQRLQAEVHAVEVEKRMLIESTSWRLTAPLRVVSRQAPWLARLPRQWLRRLWRTFRPSHAGA